MSNCPFCNILAGTEPGKIIARDNDNNFVMIQALHPEGAIHWLAMPAEHVDSTEALEQNDHGRFIKLINFALDTARAQESNYPDIAHGFTIKFHTGTFETVPHAKLHILSTE